MLDNILKSASALGACERLDKVKNFHSLTSLFFTPQGLEFCHKNNFPPLGIFQAHKNEVSDCNMYVLRMHKARQAKIHLLSRQYVG